jgi:NAD(P) transhydrogenase subunit alpha
MKIAIVKERRPTEMRVAASVETVKKMCAMGLKVVVEKGAGLASAIRDEDFKEAGATLAKDFSNTVQSANVILKVQRPLSSEEGPIDEISAIPEGATLIGMLAPYSSAHCFKSYNSQKITSFSLELVPRITRAQSMDVLSSQSNLAGYRAVIEASALFGRVFPLMMTAAGTLPPTKVLILGAGVAGLQAIATARRLGAVVSAFDVRSAAKEQVESLGATFISVESDETGEGTGGYAKEMSADYQKRQKEKIHEALQKNDIIITTALIPGKSAPLLITESMLEGIKEGSVIVDMAVEAGGNVEGSVLNQVIEKNGVKICGYGNLSSRIARDASALYARNVFNFLSLLWDKQQEKLNIDFNDEIIKATAITHEGKIIHPQFASQ